MLVAPPVAAHAPGLLALCERIALAAVPRTPRRTRTIATWNIRELGRRRRRPESLVYIAEVIRAFDLVSIVELHEDLTELRAILRLLGPTWAALYSAPVFDPGGNRERSAFVLDTRRVRHTGLASGVQAPRKKEGPEYLSKIDWWRRPYVASFSIGPVGREVELLLVTAHIRWGDNATSRIPELTLFADWIALEVAKDPDAKGRELIALGDFNVPRLDSPLYAALTRRGLTMPEALAGVHGSNLKMNKRYDQLLHGSGSRTRFTGRGGTLDFYTGGIGALYSPSVDKEEFTYELSDHLPLWAELALRDVGPSERRVIP